MCQPLLRQVLLRQVRVHVRHVHVLHYTIQLRAVLVHYYIHVLLYTNTYISYESSNQEVFPLRKMVVIRLVLDDCKANDRTYSYTSFCIESKVGKSPH